MYVHKVLRAFTNTKGGSGVNEIECDPLTIPRVSCRLWKSHSSKSSTGLLAPMAAKTRKNNNLLIVREEERNIKGKMR